MKGELNRRGVRVGDDQLANIMKEVDKNSDNKISFEEFKIAIQIGVARETNLWKAIKEDIGLQKGAKAALRRFDDLKVQKKTLSSDIEENEDSSKQTNTSEDLQSALGYAFMGNSLLFMFAVGRKIFLKI